MNFLYGVLVIAMVILALKTVMKTAAALSRWFGLLIRLGRRRYTRKDQLSPSSVGVRTLPLGAMAPDLVGAVA